MKEEEQQARRERIMKQDASRSHAEQLIGLAGNIYVWCCTAFFAGISSHMRSCSAYMYIYTILANPNNEKQMSGFTLLGLVCFIYSNILHGLMVYI